jgi:hypothetical protein
MAGKTENQKGERDRIIMKRKASFIHDGRVRKCVCVCVCVRVCACVRVRVSVWLKDSAAVWHTSLALEVHGQVRSCATQLPFSVLCMLPNQLSEIVFARLSYY